MFSAGQQGISKDDVHYLVALGDLQNYVKSTLSSGGFKSQYEKIKPGQLKPWEVGKKQENKPKNRYSDLLPYDETRVVLEPLPNELNSDYINANYIDGYKKPRAYISTQGPLEKTVPDFWRMVWQEDVRNIIMAANVVEDGKKKCEKYWPDSNDTFGKITVTQVLERVFVDYTVRTFCLKKADNPVSREVRQFHFTGWPDHGVPVYPLSLVRMLQETEESQNSTSGPVLLHCSAGVGRSGTIILLDSAIQMGKTENLMDVPGLLHSMRQNRINLVETVEQYTFVYRALVDYFFGDFTRRRYDDFEDYYKSLLQTAPGSEKIRLALQFETLQKGTPAFMDFPIQDGCKPGAICKEECLHGGTEMWNVTSAIYVGGYGTKIGYIVVPYPEKAADFWRRVYSSGSQSVVLLDNSASSGVKKHSPFWPESGGLPLGDFRLDHVISELQGGNLTRAFSLSKRSEIKNQRIVKQFQVMDLGQENKGNLSMDSFLQLLKDVTSWRQSSGNKLIFVVSLTCPSVIGAFCAGIYMADMIAEDQEVDAFLAARTLRHTRPAFVQNVETYQWLYELGCALGKNVSTHF